MTDGEATDGVAIQLPPGPATPLSEVQAERRSVKAFRSEALDVAQVGGALRHTAARIAGSTRAHASARAQYLVTVTLIAGAVRGLPAGAYRYSNQWHQLEAGAPGDHRRGLAAATVDASWLAHCPAVVLLSADTAAADSSFQELGPRQGERFAWLEAGLIAQNLYLWAASTGLGTAFIGGLDGPAMSRAARPLVPEDEDLLGLMPLGHPRGERPPLDGEEQPGAG